MSILRNAVARASYLVGASEIHAKRWAVGLLAAFDEELRDPESVFATLPGESVDDRLAFLWILAAMPGADRKAVVHIIDKFTLYALSCQVEKGIFELEERRDALAVVVAVEAENYPEIEAVLPTETAATASKWE